MVVDYLGSELHQRYKRKVANIIRRCGGVVFGDKDDEVSIPRPGSDTTAPPYSIDLCALLGTRTIVVEIDGPKGHSSKYARVKDKNRTVEIIEYFRKQGQKAEVYRFAFWQLKDCEDELIIQEMDLNKQ